MTHLVEDIAQDIVSALENITIANGYDFDIASVERPPRFLADSVARDLTAKVHQRGRVRDEEHDYEGNPPRLAWREEFEIHGIRHPTDASTAPIDQLNNEIALAIEKALKVDDTRGGRAIDTYITEIRPIEPGDKSYAGVRVTAEVLFRVYENDPETQG
jgi:hypothetical protein